MGVLLVLLDRLASFSSAVADSTNLLFAVTSRNSLVGLATNDSLLLVTQPRMTMEMLWVLRKHLKARRTTISNNRRVPRRHCLHLAPTQDKVVAFIVYIHFSGCVSGDYTSSGRNRMIYSAYAWLHYNDSLVIIVLVSTHINYPSQSSKLNASELLAYPCI